MGLVSREGAAYLDHWLDHIPVERRESGTLVKFTQAGAELFA